MKTPSFEERVAARAYRYYEEEGRPEGRAGEHWRRAREELEKEKGSWPDERDRPSQAAGEDFE